MKQTLEELTMEFINGKIIPYIEDLDYDLNDEILMLGASRTGFQEGYTLANQKLEKAKELIEYFVKRVEEGSIKSKTTYKLYKEFLEYN